jgi:lipopolysaccharide export system protein LptC
MEDKSGLTMDATSGLFDTKSQVLNLTDRIFLQSSTGYEARLTQARVDMANGTVTSDQPVAVKLLNGTLDAQRLEIVDNGELVRFEGGVSMILVLDEAAKNGAANSGSPEPADAAVSRNADAQ